MTRDLALTVLEALNETRAREARVLSAMREAWPDIGGLWLNQADVEVATVKLLDAVLGYGVASYFLLECTRGGCIEVNGRKYPIRDVADIRAFLDAEEPEVRR